MSLDVLAIEGPLRLGAFVLLGLAIFAAQRRWALRGEGRVDRRLLRNLGLVVIDSLLLRLAFPLLAIGLAVDVAARSGGLFGALAMPYAVEFILALLLLDLAIYWQHRLFHRIPLFWRLHRVHHSDIAFDVSTGVRFHPLEIAASMAIKLILVFALGPDPWAVLAFELLLSLGSLATHADIALPPALDRRLRWLLVTPSMHRIHHSTWQPETDSNYGFHLSIWDRLFRSYRAQPRSPERDMPIGIEDFRAPPDQTLLALLIQPFRTPPPPD